MLTLPYSHGNSAACALRSGAVASCLELPIMDKQQRRPTHVNHYTEATMGWAMVSSPPPTFDEVDILYRQLMEIHAIGIA
jgi:hypothetical protein